MAGIDDIQSIPSSTIKTIKYGRIKIKNNQNTNPIKTIIIPCDYFQNKNEDKAFDKLLEALNIAKPEMIFNCSSCNQMDEYFIHDSACLHKYKFSEIKQKYLDKRINQLESKKRKKIQKQYGALSDKKVKDIKWSKNVNKFIMNIYGDEYSLEYDVPISMVSHDNDTNTQSKDEDEKYTDLIRKYFSKRKEKETSISIEAEELKYYFSNDGYCSGDDLTESPKNGVNDIYAPMDKIMGDSASPTNLFVRNSEKKVLYDIYKETVEDDIKKTSNPSNKQESKEIFGKSADIKELEDFGFRTEDSNEDSNENFSTKIKNEIQDEELKLIKNVNTQEFYRNLIKGRLINIIKGLTDACQQANAYIWVSSKKIDKVGNFFVNHSIPSTTIISDLVIDKVMSSGDLELKFKNHVLHNKSIIKDPSDIIMKTYVDFLLKNLNDYDSDVSIDSLDPIWIDESMEKEKLDKFCIEIVDSMDDEWKRKMNSNKYWRVYMSGEKRWLNYKDETNQEIHLLDFKQFFKPNLTHMIYWQDPNDEKKFKNLIQERFPIGMFLIGGDDEAYYKAIDTMRQNQALFVFNYTGGAGSIVANMIQHSQYNQFRRIDDQKLINNINLWSKFSQSPKFNYINSKKFIEIQNHSQIMLQNWPDPFTSNSVLVVDSLLDSIETIQDRITENMNLVFEDFHEMGGENEDEIRIGYAWIKYHMLKVNADNLRRKANFYIILLAILSFATTFISTLDTTDHNHQWNYYTNMASVALPIVTGIIITIIYTFKPIKKWAVCEMGARLIIAEIYKFRTRTGIYRVRRKNGNTNNFEESKKARKLFADEMIKVWQNIELSEMKLGSFKKIQKIDNRKIDEFNIIQKIKYKESKAYNDTNDFYHSNININSNDNSTELYTIKPYQRMSIEMYVKTRMKIIIDQHKRSAPILDRTLQFFQVLIFFITSSAAFITHLGYVRWVPVVMSLSASIITIMEQKQLTLILSSTNSVLLQLEQLMCFWQGLSIIERRKHSNATFIVETAENTVLNELSAYVQAIKSVMDSDDSNDSSMN